MADKPILGVEDLIGRYQQGGQADSSGSFTLDPKKALERLAQFALPDPYYWILKVIQCLHLSGARDIRVDAGIHKVLLTSNVCPRGFDTMDDILTQLLADAIDVDPALRHLAAGLQGSLAVSPSQIRLRTVVDGERREYLLETGGWRETKRQKAAPDEEGFELRLIRNLSEKLGHSWHLLNADIFDLFFGRKGALDRENKVVHGKVDFTRGAVFLKNRSVIMRQFGRPRFKGYDIRSDPNPGETKPPVLTAWFSDTELKDGAAHPFHHLAEKVVPATEQGGFFLGEKSDATLTNRIDPTVISAARENGFSRAYAIRFELAALALIYFWEDGVIINVDRFNLGCPGLVALVDARGLGKDLTTLKILEDERLQALQEEIAESGRQLKKQILENLHLMPKPDLVKTGLKAQYVT